MAGWKVKNHDNGVQCSLVEGLEVYIEPVPRLKIELLMEKYEHQEWLGYLIGKTSENGKKVFVEEISIPPHKEAHAASAEAEPFHIPPRCVGFIHSHHSMGAFHSGTDQEHVDKNYPVSITVAKQGGSVVYNTVGYRVTPCGKATTVVADLKFVQQKPPFDTEHFLKKAAKNIAKGEKHYQQQTLAAYGGIPFGVLGGNGCEFPYSWTPTGKRKGALIRRVPTSEGDMFVDGSGNVLTEKEVEALLRKESGLEVEQ